MFKKITVSFIIIMVLAMTFSTMSFALGTLDQVDYEATLTLGNGWQGIYIPSADRTPENVKTDIAMTADTNWFAKIPGFGVKGAGWGEWDYTGTTIGDDCYAGMYIHPGQAKSASTGDTQDMGLMFTASKAGTYSFIFKGLVAGDESDGVKLLVYKNDFTTALYSGVVSSALVNVEIDDISLSVGEKFYVLFNKNISITEDTLTINEMSILYNSPIEFPDLMVETDTPVIVGSTFSQYFNYANTADLKAFWKPFYILDGAYAALVPHVSDTKYVIPDQTDVNMYASIWDVDLNNAPSAFQPAQNFLIGDYFIVPANGTVKIECNFWYPNNPGDNPASADGVGVRIYLNNSETGVSTLIKDREVFDFSNASGDDGKDFNVDGITVKAGDKIVFLYDVNGTPWSDATYVNTKQVVYTAVETVVDTSDDDSSDDIIDDDDTTPGDSFGFLVIIALLSIGSILTVKRVKA